MKLLGYLNFQSLETKFAKWITNTYFAERYCL